MTQTDVLNKKLSIKKQELQITHSPTQRQELNKKIQIIQYKLQIERIKDLISKLG